MSAETILVSFIQKYGPIGTIRVVTNYIPEHRRAVRRGFIPARAALRLNRKGNLFHDCRGPRDQTELRMKLSEALDVAHEAAEREGRVFVIPWGTPEVARAVATLETLGWYVSRLSNPAI